MSTRLSFRKVKRKMHCGKEYCFPLSAIHAYSVVGQKLIFSEAKIEEYRDELYAEFKNIGIPNQIWSNSLEYGDAVAKAIIDWANKDNYNQTRSFPKLSLVEEEGKWIPTPPGYMESIEPHWNKIRPFVLDSAQQFVPPPPTAFSMDPDSKFYKELIEVYDAVAKADQEEKEIASFWDCNPFVLNLTGHVMYASKKITPGGHWIGITKIACQDASKSLAESIKAYALVSMAICLLYTSDAADD